MIAKMPESKAGTPGILPSVMKCKKGGHASYIIRVAARYCVFIRSVQ